ncbi:hypothetical protein HPB49_019423 [Dermacentor silvarum]|uniref:Uncharacterized protein n=1 Tax=Dermacentor silvarum TaxID=543639 RepID=A0ACB8C515_DERSI|nr:hypothetical protein HPB49_019423 [Dermacentor silvarum]
MSSAANPLQSNVWKPYTDDKQLMNHFFGTTATFLRHRYIAVKDHVSLCKPHWMSGRVKTEEGKCFMISNFNPCRLLFRLFGCFFVQGLTEDTNNHARVTWKTPYILYTMAWLLTIGFMESDYIGATFRNLIGDFTSSVYALIELTTMANAVVNFVCMTIGSRRLLQFFQMCARYEKSAAFRAPTASEARRRDWRMRLWRIGALQAAMMMYVAVLYFYYGPRGSRTDWNTVSKVASAAAICSYMFYDWLMYLTMRSTCEVLIWYLRDQRAVFEELSKYVSGQAPASRGVRALSAPLTVESVRLNLTKIRELKACINDLWSPALVSTAVTVLLLKCCALHDVVSAGGYNDIAVVISLRAWQSALRFNELAFISQSLRDEAMNIKQSAQAATTLWVDDLYSRQVQFLHDSINPEEMCLSGGGFFRLGRPLIVSMMSALITYTVILAQTGQQLDQNHSR